MVERGYEHSRRKPESDHFLEKPFGGWILRYRRPKGVCLKKSDGAGRRS